jgi:hypothetical protein
MCGHYPIDRFDHDSSEEDQPVDDSDDAYESESGDGEDDKDDEYMELDSVDAGPSKK